MEQILLFFRILGSVRDGATAGSPSQRPQPSPLATRIHNVGSNKPSNGLKTALTSLAFPPGAPYKGSTIVAFYEQ